jgi:hypothetical protein
VAAGAVEYSAEDGELATAHFQRVTVVVFHVGVAKRSGQHVRIVRAGGLHECQAARRLENLDPTVIADYPISADEDCPPSADGDTGVLRARALIR